MLNHRVSVLVVDVEQVLDGARSPGSSRNGGEELVFHVGRRCGVYSRERGDDLPVLIQVVPVA